MMHNFDYMPALGKTDTSREAILKIIDELPRMRKMAYEAYAEARTTSEAAEFLNMRSRSIQPRTSELLKQGLIIDTGIRRENKWGNLEIVFEQRESHERFVFEELNEIFKKLKDQ
jgi:hypothetical protein